MVNTRTDTDLSAAVQNALQALLPQIREEIREEFRTGSGSSNAGGDSPPVTIHTWLERFNKQKPHSFEKATFFPRAEQERLKREYHSIRQTSSETSTEFMQRFLRLAGFLGAAAGTEKEQAKNFQWGLRRSTLNHLMCMSYTDVAQVANSARNYEILHERDDQYSERPDKQQRSGDRHQQHSQQSSHRSHGQNNDRHGSDRRGGNDNHRGNNNSNNYSGSNNRIPGMDGDKRTGGHRPTELPILVPSNLGVPLRVTPTQFAPLADVGTRESVAKPQVHVSSVAKLAIYRKIAGRTPPRFVR
nr:zinc finger, CCHC-type, retrotransposon Gag domain protein [Tanacetum cinerariifolium]